MNERARIAFVVSGLASHVFSAIGVARRFAAAGYNVEIWGDAACRHQVSRQRMQFRELGGIRFCYDTVIFSEWHKVLLNPAALMRVAAAARSRLRTMGADLQHFDRDVTALLGEGRVSLVILDSLLAHYFPLFSQRGIKCVQLQDKPISEPDSRVPPPTTDCMPPRSAPGRALTWLKWQSEIVDCAIRRALKSFAGVVGFYNPDLLLAAIARYVDAPCRQKPRRRLYYDLYFAELEEWVLGDPDSDLPRAFALDSRIRYIGLCVDNGRIETPAPVLRKADTKFLIYVSMGVSATRWSSDIALIRRIVSAFGDLPSIQVVVSAGSRQACEAVKVAYDNVQVFSALPQMKMLRMADLAIMHGGANGFRECVNAGVPMLVFPREFDQPGNAARVVFRKWGLCGRRRWDGSKAIRRKAMQILEDAQFRTSLNEWRRGAFAVESRLFDQALVSVGLEATVRGGRRNVA